MWSEQFPLGEPQTISHSESYMVAGQPEAEMELVRRAEGIPLHPEVTDFIRDTCGELGVTCLV